ncbi:MAG: branched-chain amino acid ABC transporter permease [Betaproteobacteria bacterium]|nr:branched-chain amino acid ABC transporter permease [Betaproteobacteria bacterium]
MTAYLVAVGIVALIYMLLTIGLNLQYGYTGLINFGVVAFFAIGAYTAALLTLAGWSLAPAFVVAMVAAGLLAYPIGLLSLRLSDDYLAVVTLGFSEVVRLVIQQERWLTNGVQGLPGIPRMFQSLGVGEYAELATLAVLVLCNLAAIAVMLHLVRSPYGRLIQAIRDDEVAVEAIGKDPRRLKVQVFMLGSGLAGLAGAFYAHFITYLSPDQFLPLVTFYVWIAMIIGGTGRTSGAAVGSLILMVFLEGSRFARDWIPGVSEVQMASVRLALVGLALILFTIYRPQGMMGTRQ